MNERTKQSALLMREFARRTGLTSPGTSTRYLWTDAFAVCNFLALGRATGERSYRELALALVERVHNELGWHRKDDVREGWISGLSEEEGRAHPTKGGLRIGKALPERRPNEPFDPNLEWDRDGQYFHYLTKWMHALARVSRATGRVTAFAHACELAIAAHRAFTYGPAGRRRMRWKMSIDLSRAVVSSMGQHDPLDGLVTCLELERTGATLGASAPQPALSAAIDDFASMLDLDSLVTADPLGLGGLLADAYRLSQIGGDPGLVAALLGAAGSGMRRFAVTGDLQLPAHRRLAFRELGLAIGLTGAAMLAEGSGVDARIRERLDTFVRWQPLREEVETFWRVDAHRQTDAWVAHQDINDVMLASALVPEGFLVLSP